MTLQLRLLARLYTQNPNLIKLRLEGRHFQVIVIFHLLQVGLYQYYNN